jgi:hypothetical protein
MTDLKALFTKLGLDETNGLYITKDDLWKNETAFPNRVKRLIERKILPDAFFCFDNKPLILFFNNPDDKEELHKAIWNFNECPIAIIVDKGSIEIFNGFNYLKDKASLEKIGGTEKLNDFSYFELVTGRTWEQYNEQLGYKNRIDYHLLENIKAARDLLVSEHELDTKIVNAIIGKSIFVRYLIDRKVKMKFDGKLRIWSNDEFCELLSHPKLIKDFFDYLEDNERGFNGDLFPLNATEYKKIRKEDYQVLRRLLKGEDINNGQLSLFQLYDFSIIPIEFISNVYELFIGESNQQAEGAYYTPLFLVDYILKETVDKKLSQTESDYNCKVLDPACGSGIFLVETLRKIIEKYVNETGIDTKSEKFKTAIRNLAKENIFGIDKDLSAVQVAVFSIYLTLLDYLEPPGIETFKFPNLINGNFFNADFFDQTSVYNSELKNIEFDFIIGNPPWMRGKGEIQKPLYVQYIDGRRKKEKNLLGPKIQIGNKEIAQSFLLRSSDFSTVNTKCALIATSKVLYNLQSIDFRKYFLHYFLLDRIFELAPVRKEVFDKSNDKAIAPACILFYNYANNKPTGQNIVEHISLKPSRFFSLFKIFTIHRTDLKKVEQGNFEKHDWLFKLLLYGSYLDFNFIKRLKNEYKSIENIISDGNDFVSGTGVQYSSNPTYNSSHLKGLPFIDAYAVMPFFIIPEKVSIFSKSKVHRIRNEKLFKPPMLLIRKGLDMSSLTSYCAVCTKNAVFKDSITSIAIAATNKESINSLYDIGALLSSNLFTYYAICSFSSVGIEREQSHSNDKFSLPFVELKTRQNIETIEKQNKIIHKEQSKALQDNFVIQTATNYIEGELGSINDTIYDKLEMTEVELSLIDYSLNVSKVLITGNDSNREMLFSKLCFKDDILKKYASVFLKRFKSAVEKTDKKFIVEIWITDQIIGMFFKTIHQSEYTESICWENKHGQDISVLSFLSKLSSEKLTDRLFIQKDIRGFEKDYFYIIKPNEKKLWHTAIGYWDVNEFADAILKAGRADK